MAATGQCGSPLVLRMDEDGHARIGAVRLEPGAALFQAGFIDHIDPANYRADSGNDPQDLVADPETGNDDGGAAGGFKESVIDPVTRDEEADDGECGLDQWFGQPGRFQADVVPDETDDPGADEGEHCPGDGETQQLPTSQCLA